MDLKFIRNFCIIAHIDHGKSTLADRMLQKTGSITAREFRDQMLDSMDLERERGITIKASAVSMAYLQGGEKYLFNLIDTPGHVDFGYEVSRALVACEGAILVVDASQGIEAQTMANVYKAMEHDLELIPVLNKIDLPNSRPDEVTEEICNAFGFKPEEVLNVSAKTGEGVDALLEAVVRRIPAPKGDPGSPLRGLIFDSEFDDYRGVVLYLRLLDGAVAKNQKIRLLREERDFEGLEIGQFAPAPVPCESLHAGQVGYCASNIKSLDEVNIGDTVTTPAGAEAGVKPLPGYREPKPMVFCGLFPINSADFEKLRKALEKLHLNDSSFQYAPESSAALGFGFRCGFLGLLHMDIIRERLERESDLDLIQTAPNVTYELVLTNGKIVRVSNPSEVPGVGEIEEFREPMVRTSMILQSDVIGNVMTLCEEHRGKYVKQEYMTPQRVVIEYDLPLAEIVYDFYDKLKSASRGYATMDYEEPRFVASDLVRLDVLVGGTSVDALSCIVHRSQAYHRGRAVLKKLREEIPRHMFLVVLQAAIGGKIISREEIRALSKNVTAKCYGGDITRKRKLWEKQKEGKKRMKNVGKVEIPQKAFLAVLSAD